MSGRSRGGAHGGNTNLAYNDGNTSYQYASSTWSSDSHHNGSGWQTQLQPPAQPAILQLPDADFAQQHHQQALSMAQSMSQSIQQSMQQHQNMMQQHQNMMQNSFQSMMPFPFPNMPAIMQQPASMQYVSSHHASHQLSSPPMSAPSLEYPQQLQITAPQTGYVEDPDEESSASEDSFYGGDSDQGEDVARIQDKRYRQIAQRQATMEQAMSAGVDRVRQQKNREIKALKERERVREREIARLRKEKEQAMEQQHSTQQQMLMQQQQHQAKISEIMKANASSPSFDLSAMSQMMTQIVQQDRDKSLDHLKKSLGDQLSGVARASDIAKAAVHLDRKFEKLPAGATPKQVENAVRGEIESLMQKAADRMSRQQNRVEPTSTPARYHSTLEVEDLSEPVLAKPMRAAEVKNVKSDANRTGHRQRALPPFNEVDAAMSSRTKSRHTRRAGDRPMNDAQDAEAKPLRGHTSKFSQTVDGALNTVKRSAGPSSFHSSGASPSPPAVSRNAQRTLPAPAPAPSVSQGNSDKPQRTLPAPAPASAPQVAQAALQKPQRTLLASPPAPITSPATLATPSVLSYADGTLSRSSGHNTKSKAANVAVLASTQNALSRVKKSESKPDATRQDPGPSAVTHALMRPKSASRATPQSSAQGAVTLAQTLSNQLSKQSTVQAPAGANRHVNNAAAGEVRSIESGPRQVTLDAPEAGTSFWTAVKTSKVISKRGKR